MFLYQDKNGFLFNSDAHFLYHFISEFNPKGKVLDVGCGCGIVGLLVARDFDIELTALDLQEQNCKLTEINARVNGISTNIIHSDFLEFSTKDKFDIIISNPPYYHDGVSKTLNPQLHKSRYNQHLPLEAFIKKANSLIKPKGSLIFCYDAKQIQSLLKLLEEYKFRVNDIRFLHPKMDKPSSLVFIHAKKSSKSLTIIHPPLIHFVGDEMSQEAKDIYHKTRTYSIKCII